LQADLLSRAGDGVTKTLALIAKAPSQEEQIEYALSLRSVRRLDDQAA